MANCRPYLLLGGTLTDTQPLYFSHDRMEILFQVHSNEPKFIGNLTSGAFFFLLQHKNLGILTTLRIGFEDALGSGRWLIEYVIVRNEITGRAFK